MSPQKIAPIYNVLKLREKSVTTDKTPSRSRSPIFFSTGLLAAAILAVGLDQGALQALKLNEGDRIWRDIAVLQVAPPRAPGAFEERAARIAWSYIEANTRPETGLVDSVTGFPSTTLWDQGSYRLGLVSARRLNLIEDQAFRQRVSALLTSFESLPLFEGRLPNKVYNTQTLAMTNYKNEERADGIGWSALDVARMLASFRILERHAPEFGDRIRGIIGRWDLNAMTREGELVGASNEDGATVYPQEGRIGYEQYGARAAGTWSMDVSRAISAQRIVNWKTISGMLVPVDLRTDASHGAINPTTSEPYFLQALEFGFDSEGQRLASQIYKAQQSRFEDTGIFTMVSEDHLDQPPYFAYGAIFSNAREWAVVDELGENFPELRTVSLKATFAWEAIFGSEYATLLREDLSDNGSLETGWAAGTYERTRTVNEAYTLNTNAIVLEALHFRSFGPLWDVD